MNMVVRLLQWHTPTFVKKWALHDLFVATAAAFGCTAPALNGRSYRECLRLYAQFTQSQVEAMIRDGRDLAAVKERLYANAFQLGQKYARLLRIRNQAAMRVIGRLLYAILDIDFQSNAQGEVVIRRCYFSRFYTGPICQVMSAMDRGLFAGLSDGGQLRFAARITEGSPCCLAHFTLLAAGSMR
ncbi:MAG: hypothetical protein DYG89_02465 [Caldilinea sp. CFX5]|nr:hypothetical protein [Caldilinea sp. CFX5]